jgi:hypothetical protein
MKMDKHPQMTPMDADDFREFFPIGVHRRHLRMISSSSRI